MESPASPSAIGKQVQKRRLLQLRRKSLAQRAVENGIARGVGEVGEDDGVLLGQAMRWVLAKVEIDGHRRHSQ